jgi:peptide/nickel transport system permease protein
VQTSNRTYLVQLRQRHWLGTDLRGSDVLADMIFAMRNSLLISVIATFISFVIGSFMGVAAGWNTDAGGFQVKESEFILILIFAFLIFFSVSELASIKEKCLFLAFTFSGVYFAFKIVKRLQLKWRVKAFYIKIPAGFLIDRLSELFLAIPRLLMLIVVIQFLPRSIPTLAFAIGITSWVDVSRLIKAEVIILKQQSFVEAAGMTGMKKLRLFLKHLLPNIWPSVMVVLMYCFSGNILMDASLSFLGFGLPADTLSIGGMLATARTYYEAWWMFLFPGIWISLLIYAVFTLPDALLKSNAARY